MALSEHWTRDELVSELNKSIYGNPVAKRRFANAVWRNNQRKLAHDNGCEISQLIPKASVFITGPPGSGKSALMGAVSEALGVPYHIQDSSILSASGFEGGGVAAVLDGLVTAAKGSVSRAQQGIIQFDEIDSQIASFRPGDPRGKAVQKSLLTLLEGTTSFMLKEGQPNQIAFTPRHVTIVLAGACVGINETDRLSKHSLLEFGFTEEFVDRMTVKVEMVPPSRDDLEDLISRHLFQRWVNVFSNRKTQLEYDKAFLDYLVESCESGGSIRQLENIIYEFMEPHFGELSANDYERIYFAFKDESEPYLVLQAKKRSSAKTKTSKANGRATTRRSSQPTGRRAPGAGSVERKRGDQAATYRTQHQIAREQLKEQQKGLWSVSNLLGSGKGITDYGESLKRWQEEVGDQ